MSSTGPQISSKRGHPLPAGVTNLEEGLNFAVFSRHATRVALVIDHKNEFGEYSRTEIELDSGENRTGDMWHILLETFPENFCYGFRMDGPKENGEDGHCYNYEEILIDPYCRSLLPRKWGEPAEYGTKPCCRILIDDFDWGDDRPLKTPLADTVIYELHIRGFTQSDSSTVSAPGTYLGVIEKIPYLLDLGITAVELLPVTEFDENDTVFQDPQTGKRLKNFWGYNPVSFFALHSGYAQEPEQAINEFKTMVRALHKAGIEVYLDIVYNHTGEGGYDGTTSSFRGIDNSIYYLLDDKNNYHNFSGCGNTLNCNHPVVRELIRESLRYWVTEMHIDGFRFDLASILGRDQQGHVLPNPPMIEIIGQDPVLRDTKMIAEAWDAAGLYQVGSFASDTRWGEWNGRFRDDVRAFMAGHEGMVAHLATRIAGSSDLYQTSGRSPLCSINFITSHDGFTLNDLVSYDKKHNENNGENNRDGDNHNLSWNSGKEGLARNTAINTLRLRRMKTFTTLLLLSQGIPMICAGDEFARTQMGNNNAWCQDNEISWLDWSMLQKNKDLHRFFTNCIALRKKYDLFRREDFFAHHVPNSGETIEAEISWQYLHPDEQNWGDDCHGLAFLLQTPPHQEQLNAFFIMLNSQKDESLVFTPPKSDGKKYNWRKIIDTTLESPGDFTLFEKAPTLKKTAVPVAPFGCIVLQASKENRQTITATKKGTSRS